MRTADKDRWKVHAQLLAVRAYGYFVTSSMCAPVSMTLLDTETMAGVREYVDAFNKGDAEAMAVNCVESNERA